MKNQLLFCFLLFFGSIGTMQGFCQHAIPGHQLYFISDSQQPMMLEKICLRPFRNEEARDSLFADLVRQKPPNLFFLGDLTAKGSNKKSWNPVADLLLATSKQGTTVHAIPGNHEYYFNARKGIRNYKEQFPNDSLTGYCVKVDSMAVLMLNSNFNKLNSKEIQNQQIWFNSTMEALDSDEAIKTILLCSHHSPFTNSKVVKPSREVALLFLPGFYNSPKAKLFISGHSHNLEYFEKDHNKHFLVIGGGGGLSQPLLSPNKRMNTDLIQSDKKPLYFYLIAERKGMEIKLSVRGLQKDFSRIKTFEIGGL